jgi:HAD superfamily hydrolase (TIGR01509 family)
VIRGIIFDCFGVLVDNGLNQQLLDYIRTELKPYYKIGMLSNAGMGTIEHRLPVKERVMFDAIVVSGNTVYQKPDVELFQMIVDQLDISFDEAVFIDDLEYLTITAAKLGSKTIHYQDFAQFKLQLGKILTKN